MSGGSAPSARRRAPVVARTAAIAAAAISLSGCSPSGWPDPRAVREALDDVHREVRSRVLAGDLARPNGFAYAVDVGELMRASARLGDREMYAALRAFALDRLVVDDPDDPFTRGFVLWRRTPAPEPGADDPPDASGTTEALRMSQALREGWAAFGDEADRELALVVLDGYARHASDAAGLLLIRNYFNFGSRDFATNSFLVDYAPDHVAEVARAEGRRDLAALAARSYEVVRAARSPAGLIYDVFQPEMATLFDDRRTLLYSPNDIVQTSNAASIALHAARGAPEVARRVLGFCLERMPGLRLAYYGRTAEEARAKRPGIEIWGTLVELSVLLDDERALAAFAPFLVSNATAGRIPSDAFLYVAGQLLLGLEALDRRRSGAERNRPR